MKEKELRLLDEKGVETVLREMAQERHGSPPDSKIWLETDAWVRS